MPQSFSGELRERVIDAVEAGASRREAAEHFEVSVASAVKWLQRWRENRSAAPKPRGESISPLEQFATEILALVAEHGVVRAVVERRHVPRRGIGGAQRSTNAWKRHTTLRCTIHRTCVCPCSR